MSRLNLSLFSIFFALAFSGKSQTFEDDSTQVSNLLSQALINLINRDSIIEDVNRLVNKSKDSLLLKDVYYYHLSRMWFVAGDLDKAYENAFLGFNLNKQQLHLRQNAKFLNLIGSILAIKGDYDAAIDAMVKSVKVSETFGDFHKSALIKNNIANIFFSLRDYESAYDYAWQSYTYLKEEGDSVNLPAIIGVTAVSAIKLNKFEQGKYLTEECLTLSHRLNDPVGLIVGYYARGELFQLNEDYKGAIESFEESLELSLFYKQEHYALLAKIGLLQSHLNIKDYLSAIKYGTEAIEESQARENTNVSYSIHRQLGEAFAGLKQFEPAYEYLHLAHESYMTYAGMENREVINDLLIEYETEKKEKELIEQELELIRTQKQINDRNALITVLSFSLLVALIGLIALVKWNRQRQFRIKTIEEKRRMNALFQGEEQERKRISQELHDGIASSITGVKIQLELAMSKLQDAHSLDVPIAELSQIQGEIRKISHNLMPIDFEEMTFAEVIEQYCLENSNEKLRLRFYNNSNIQEDIEKPTTQILYRIVQELIHNVQKHANASECIVQLNKQRNALTLSIEDNGDGFDLNYEKGSQGLKSIRKRIAEIGGTMEIDTEIGKGTMVVLNLDKR